THTRPLSLFRGTPPTELHTLSLHDALPICLADLGQFPDVGQVCVPVAPRRLRPPERMPPVLDALDRGLGGFRELRLLHDLEAARSEEHTSELQSRENLVCRLLLEKKKNKNV